MEKKLPMDSASELDQLIDLLDQPKALQLRMDALRNSSSPLADEVEGFMAYYDAYQGDTVRIKEKLALQEKKILQPITTSSTHWLLNKWAAAIALILAGGITYMLLNKNCCKTRPSTLRRNWVTELHGTYNGYLNRLENGYG
jgi:hypothetical protein